jgi:guanylate kinase
MELSDAVKQKITHYKPDPAKLDSIRQAPLLFTVGITGSGKNALLQKLLELHPNNYYFLLSYTTRQPRDTATGTEKDGDQYHFVSIEEFEKCLDNQELVEAQIIHDKDLYGTSIAEIAHAQELSKVGVSDVDVQGIAVYKSLALNLKPVFVLPPSFQEWQRRLNARGEMTDAEKTRRYQSAVEELEAALHDDYYYFVVNDDLEAAAQRVNAITENPNHDSNEEQTAARSLAEVMIQQITQLLKGQSS